MLARHWYWLTPEGWPLLLHWSCPAAAAAGSSAVTVAAIDASPGLPLAERCFVFMLSFGTIIVSMAMHEYGHVAMARILNLEILGVALWGGGGATLLRRAAPTPRKDALFAVGGPLSSACVTAIVGGIALTLPHSVFRTVVAAIAVLNALFAVASLIPAYPLDGGLLLRALGWHVMGDRSIATLFAIRVGQSIGLVLLVAGVTSLAAPIGWLSTLVGFGALIGPTNGRSNRNSLLAAIRRTHEVHARTVTLSPDTRL